MKRDGAFRSVAILGFILALASTAWANGEEFFAPAKNGKIDLVYYGRIKDSRTGRSVTDSVYFNLTDKSTGLSFPFTNDKPGHFRSPDVGTAIKEIGEKIDAGAFEVTVNAGGYKRATITRMPRKAQGSAQPQPFAATGRDAEQPPHLRIAALRHPVDISRRDAQLLRGNHRENRPAEHVGQIDIALAHDLRQRLFRDLLRKNPEGVGLPHRAPQRSQFRDIRGKGVAAPGRQLRFQLSGLYQYLPQ